MTDQPSRAVNTAHMATKPSPVADPDSQPFWDGCRDGRLMAQQCDACGRWRWPPRGICPGCSAWAHQWRPLSGTGVVQAFVVPHRAFSPAFADDVPYVVVHVVLDGTDDQVVLVSNLEGLGWQAASVGMRVEVFFDQRGLPKFRPV